MDLSCYCDPKNDFQAGCLHRQLRRPPVSVLDMAPSSSDPSPIKAEGSKAPVTTYPAVSPPVKRKREDIVESSESIDNAIYLGPPTNKKFKPDSSYTTSSQAYVPTLYDRDADDHTSPGSSMPQVRPVGRTENKQYRNSQKSAVKDEHEYLRHGRSTEHDLDIVHAALLQTEAQNTELQRALAECQGKVLRAKQDMMLDHIMQRDANRKELQQVRKEKAGIQKSADTYRIAKLELEKTLKAMTSKFTSTTSRNKALQHDVDNLNTLVKSLYDDLNELRQLESEEIARRKQQEEKLALPPAYEDLRRRSQQPPYEKHIDDGPFDQRRLEASIKKDFDDALRRAHQYRIELLKSDNVTLQTKGHSTIFTSTANALVIVCGRLRPVLASTYATPKWIAPLVIELSWRAASACEVRPIAIHLTALEKQQAGLAFKQVDELLLEALKQEFDAGGPKELLRVYDMQKHLMQTQMLRNCYSDIQGRTGYGYFEKTVQWLTEQVEHDRMEQANS